MFRLRGVPKRNKTSRNAAVALFCNLVCFTAISYQKFGSVSCPIAIILKDICDGWHLEAAGVGLVGESVSASDLEH